MLRGGRGASSGISVRYKPYGSEYKAVYTYKNIKFLEQNDKTKAVTPPMETMTQGRVYATISDNKVKFITYYDSSLKRLKQIDVTGKPHKVDGKSIIPHIHYGYLHDENGTYELTKKENRMVARVLNAWYNHINK